MIRAIRERWDRWALVRLGLLAVGVLLGHSASGEQEPSGAVAARAAQSAAGLREITEEYWNYLQRHSIEIRSLRGLAIDHLPDVSMEFASSEAEFAAGLLERLADLEEVDLGPEERDTLGALGFALLGAVEKKKHFWVMPQLTPYASPIASVGRVFDLFAFPDSAAAGRYLRLLDQLPGFFGQLATIADQQAQRGVRMARPALERALPPIEALRRPPGQSRWRPMASRLVELGDGDRAAFLGEVDRRIEGAINPALDRLIVGLRAQKELAPVDVGLGQYPGGREAYRALVRRHTTLDLAPEEIHRMGLAEIGRIDRALEDLRPAFAFEGSAAEFRQYLRGDPRFFARQAEDLGERMTAALERMAPVVGIVFHAAARSPSGVERLDPSLEGAMTFGYYDPPRPERPRGVYYYNGSRPEQRSLLPMAALAYHELIPGHHFQVEAQRSNQSLPAFRQETWITAYGEGWANYASDIADELGLYSDPWDKAGYLLLDAFLSARLVVDTGMNALGWSRERAAEFLRERTNLSSEEIATETLRYSCDIPGQALAYKLGALRIRELRDSARSALGDSFDPRDFHEVILSGGNLPLGVLADRVERWVATRRAARRIE